MLKNYLAKNSSVFKLILGASNIDIRSIIPVFNMYYKNGCRFFDIAPSPDLYKALRQMAPDAYICVSFVMDGDPHAKKAIINKKKCTKCGACYKICKDVDDIRKCSGCGKCLEVCFDNAINMTDMGKILNTSFSEILKLNPDCIELHIKNARLDEIESYLHKLKLYRGMISLCGGAEDFRKINLIAKRFKPYTMIIQADGKPVSGFDDEITTTMPCINSARVYQNIPQYLFVSGGTNSRTRELLIKNGIKVSGVAFGSWARKITNPLEAKKLILSIQPQN